MACCISILLGEFSEYVLKGFGLPMKPDKNPGCLFYGLVNGFSQVPGGFAGKAYL